MKISIQKIDATKINWKQYAHYRSKYAEIHNRIWTMPTETAIKITFAFPIKNMNTFLQNFRKKRTIKKGFSIRTKRLDKEGKIWAIRKDKRIENKK